MRCMFAAVAALLVLSTPAFADVRVVISKSQQQMAVSVDGGPSYRWMVSTGRPGYTTPSGNFRAIRLEQVYYSKKYDNAPMPHAVFFHGGYAIHGTMEERHLGRAVSHGCVRLSRAHAAILFDAVRRAGMGHTHIVITDAPLYGGMPVARQIEVPADASRDREAMRQAPEYYEYPRGYYYVERPADDWSGSSPAIIIRAPGYADRRPPGYAAPRPLTRREQRELAREEARREAQARYRMRLEPGRVYSEAELRRFYRDNGFEW